MCVHAHKWYVLYVYTYVCLCMTCFQSWDRVVAEKLLCLVAGASMGISGLEDQHPECRAY